MSRPNKMPLMPGTRSHSRSLIRVDELITLAQDSLLSIDGKKLNTTELSTIKMLLNKRLPDIKVMEITGEEGGAVDHEFKISYTDDSKKST